VILKQMLKSLYNKIQNPQIPQNELIDLWAMPTMPSYDEAKLFSIANKIVQKIKLETFSQPSNTSH